MYMNPERRSVETSNFNTALSAVLEHAGHGRELKKEDLIKWHKLLMADSEKAGVVRTKSNARCGNRLFVRGSEVNAALDKYLKVINEYIMAGPCDQVGFCAKAAFAFYHLINIHPFSDGNGRTARLLVIWVLRRSGFPLLVALCGKGTSDSHPALSREAFIDAVKRTDETNGACLEPMINHIKRCCDDSVLELKSASASAMRQIEVM